MGKILKHMKKIKLTKGKHALVDDCEYDRLNAHRWCVSVNGYAVRASPQDANGRKHLIYMHKEVVHSQPGVRIYHRNENRLDNRSSNLRINSRAFTKRFITSIPQPVNGMRGVYQNLRSGVYTAYIKIKGKSCQLGKFATAADAQSAYDAEAKKLNQ